MFSLLSKLSTELRHNTRLRMGIWLIAALLLSYFVIRLHDYQTQLKQNHHAVLTRLVQLQTISDQVQWIERAQQTQTLRNQLQAKLWQADTKGLAHATFQQWLNKTSDKTKLTGLRLQVQSVVEVPKTKNLWQVSAKLKADFNAESFNSLLLAIVEHARLIVTERLEIRKLSKPRFTLILTAYFQGGIGNGE